MNNIKLIPFDLEKALAGHPWGTRDTEGAKLLDTEREESCRWIAIFKDGSQDTFSSEGKNNLYFEVTEYDLFLYEEQKVGWVVVHNYQAGFRGEEAYTEADKLLYEKSYKEDGSYIATFEVNY